MCKLILNLKIKFALANLQVFLKQKHCFLWLLPLFLYLIRNKHNQTVIPTHIPCVYLLVCTVLLVKSVCFVPLHCFQHFCKKDEPWHYFLESQLVYMNLPAFAIFSCCLSFSVLLFQIQNLEKKSISFRKSGIEIQLGEQPLCWKGCWARSSEVTAIKTSAFVLVSAAAVAGRAGLAGFLDDPHLDSCSSTHSGFHRCQCWLPTVEKLNLCTLANVQTVPSL